jgi:hypothetical protein
MSTLDQGITLSPGAYPVMVSESSPPGLVLINRGTGLVWVGSNSNVGPSNGTPLEGETSLAVTPGELWVVLDSAETAPVVVYPSTRAAGPWQASPAVTATQTASNLLKTGVPNVLTGSQIYAAGFVTAQPIDVSAYASVVLSISPSWIGSAGLLRCVFTDAAGNTLASKTLQIARFGFTGARITIMLNVAGPKLQTTFTGSGQVGSGTPMTIYASNRAVPRDCVSTPPSSRIYTTDNVPITSGSPIPFFDLDPGAPPHPLTSGTTTLDAGQYSCRLTVSSPSVTGRLQLNGVDAVAGATSYAIQDTTGLATGALSKYWIQSLPAGVFSFSFMPTVTGSALCGFELQPCAM